MAELAPPADISLGAAHTNPREAYRDVPILKRPVWRNEVSAYFYLGGISAGSAIIGSLAELFGGEKFERLSRAAHYVSFATFVPCPPLLIADLGMPSRFHHMLRVFKPASPMNLGAWAFLLHGAGATFTVGRMLAAEGRLPVIGFLYDLLPEKLLVALGMPSSLALAGYTGVLLGTTSVPVWNTSPLLGALFMASAFSTGAAATSVVGTLTHRHDEAGQHALSAIGLASGAMEGALLVGYVATSDGATRPYREGLPGALMAAALALIGLSLSFDMATLITKRRKGRMSLLAGGAALVGGAFLRWAVIHAGRASAEDREITLHAMRPRKRVPGWAPPNPTL